MPVTRYIQKIFARGNTEVIGPHVSGATADAMAPYSELYEAVRGLLADPAITLRDLLDLADSVEPMTDAERVEMDWALVKMDATPGLMDTLMATVRTGFEHHMTIEFKWFEQPNFCSVLCSVQNHQATVMLGTPMLDLTKLAGGTLVSGPVLVN